MKSITENSKVDTLLIAACLIPQLLVLFLGGALDELLVFRISLGALFVLACYYWLLHKDNIYASSVVLILIALVLDAFEGHQSVAYSYRIFFRVLFGLWFLVATVKLILESKNFELITFLAALFLVMNIVFYTPFAQDRNAQMILLFGSTFTLATVVYYENLWERYHAVEKKWILLCLISLVLDVLYFSKEIF